MLAGPSITTASWGCAAAQPATFETASRLPDEERHPDGVAVDLPNARPETRSSATTGDAVVALRTPLGVDAARRTVRAFFDAVLREDLTALTARLVPGAQVEDLHPSTGVAKAKPTKRQEARSLWNQRFRKLAYEALESRVVYREADVETFRAGELDRQPPSMATLTEDARPSLTNDDLLLRVPIITPTVGSERLFGDEIFFWLRRHGDRYVIYHLAEPFPF